MICINLKKKNQQRSEPWQKKPGMIGTIDLSYIFLSQNKHWVALNEMWFLLKQKQPRITIN